MLIFFAQSKVIFKLLEEVCHFQERAKRWFYFGNQKLHLALLLESTLSNFALRYVEAKFKGFAFSHLCSNIIV